MIDGFNVTDMINKQIVIILFAFLTSCQNNKEEVKKADTKKNYPIETGKDVEINYTDSGYTKAIVKAPLLERYVNENQNYTEMSKGIDVQFLTKNGTVESFLKAKYAIRFDKERKMVAKNDVVVLNINGDTLRTSELTWDETKQKVFSDKEVRITTKSEIIKGEGFESDMSFKNPKIYKISGVVSTK